jgi:hypothetical protein
VTQRFVRGLLIVSAAMMTFFALEFFLEWFRLGRPGAEALTWADTNNAKLVDLLSPVARAYNNILAMLLATIGLAIPLTANMHTPKLIEMFLRDRLNRAVLYFFAAAAANVIYVAYLVGPDFAPVWAIRTAVYGALVGWAILIPYFFYVVRFLDPSNILDRLGKEARDTLDRAAAGQMDTELAQNLVHERAQQITTVVIKSLDRADRSVALEGIWALKRLLDHYGSLKASMPAAIFKVDRADFVGFSQEALDIVMEEKTWFETKVLGQVLAIYQHALSKAVDVVSSISDCTRVVAVRADERGDENVTELVIRCFNTYLREAIKAKNVRAVHDIFYQYRLLAKDLRERPQLLKDILFYFRYYADSARRTGLAFVAQLAAFDTAYIVRRAYEIDSSVKDELLAEVLALEHIRDGELDRFVIKAKIVLGGFFLEHDLEGPAQRVASNLVDIPSEVLQRAERELLEADRTFFEITDRQLNLEWVAPARRPHVQAFVAQLTGVRPSHP